MNTPDERREAVARIISSAPFPSHRAYAKADAILALPQLGGGAGEAAPPEVEELAGKIAAKLDWLDRTRGLGYEAHDVVREAATLLRSLAAQVGEKEVRIKALEGERDEAIAVFRKRYLAESLPRLAAVAMHDIQSNIDTICRLRGESYADEDLKHFVRYVDHEPHLSQGAFSALIDFAQGQKARAEAAEARATAAEKERDDLRALLDIEKSAARHYANERNHERAARTATEAKLAEVRKALNDQKFTLWERLDRAERDLEVQNKASRAALFMSGCVHAYRVAHDLAQQVATLSDNPASAQPDEGRAGESDPSCDVCGARKGEGFRCFACASPTPDAGKEGA